MERVILLAVQTDQTDEEMKYSLDELGELVKTAGGQVVDRLVQNRRASHPTSYIGSGKAQELKGQLACDQVDLVVTDDSLKPNQLRNLEEILEVKVLDRGLLILDIFAKHAHTKEGKCQVELAMLQDRLTRLAGQGPQMSRLAGGIGTRGPGEKQLETDRRHIMQRVHALKQELKGIKKHRTLIRESQRRRGQEVVAIVGYTNAGKSTLLNWVSQAQVYVKNQLFATLDPTTRECVLPDGQGVLMTDTVGFIRKLPHHLVEAFHSTLEEVAYADLIIHVVDGHHPYYETHMSVVYDTLASLGAGHIPVITAFNKKELFQPGTFLADERADAVVHISALKQDGLEQLLKEVQNQLRRHKILIKKTIPFSDGDLLERLHSLGDVLVEEYNEKGTYVEVYLEEAYVNKFNLKEV